jgi:hypothetical protein
MRIPKSKKDRQYNGQNKKKTRLNNDVQNITQKIKYPATRTALKTRDELGNQENHNLKQK